MAGEWVAQTIDESMAAIIDYRGKTPRKTTAGVPLITAKVVKGGRIETPDEFIAESDYTEWMRRGIPEPGDVVVTTEAPLGEVAQLGNERVALAQRLICLRGKPGVLSNGFLKFLMQSDAVQEQLHSRASGTTVLGIKQSELRKVVLLLPPIEEQRAIAHILGTLDDKIELNRRMSETLDAMARALFKAWFVDFEPVRAKHALSKVEGIEGRWQRGQSLPGLPTHLYDLFPDRLVDSSLGAIPQGWEVKIIDDLAEIIGGSTPSTVQPAYWDDGIHCWATPKDLSALKAPVLLNTERRVTDAGLAQISSGLLPKGTVLLSSRAPIGYLAIAEVPVAINQGFVAMKPRTGVPNLFLLLWARAAHEDILARANGSTFLEISKANFRPLRVVGPPLSVLNAFDRIARPMYERIVFIERESNALATLRDTLLPMLISGELRLKNAAWLAEVAA
jgi:type I restriction enzyme S subunit